MKYIFLLPLINLSLITLLLNACAFSNKKPVQNKEHNERIMQLTNERDYYKKVVEHLLNACASANKELIQNTEDNKRIMQLINKGDAYVKVIQLLSQHNIPFRDESGNPFIQFDNKEDKAIEVSFSSFDVKNIRNGIITYRLFFDADERLVKKEVKKALEKRGIVLLDF